MEQEIETSADQTSADQMLETDPIKRAAIRAKNAMERAATIKATRIRKSNVNDRKKHELEEIMSKPLEQMTSIVNRGCFNGLVKDTPEYNEILAFRATKEYINAARELEIRTRQEKILLAQSRTSEISQEQRLAAGYIAIPAGLSLATPLSSSSLRGDLASVAVPIPADFLKSNLFGEGKAVVFAADGTNLLDDQSVRAIRALEHKLGILPALTENRMNLENQSEPPAVGGEIITTAADHILALPFAKELGLTATDIAISKENEEEIRKYLVENDFGLQLVKPFSIPAGIIGCTKLRGKDALIAFDMPDFRTGQPGQLLMIAKGGAFSAMPNKPIVYNPNVDIDIASGTIVNDPLRLAQNECSGVPNSVPFTSLSEVPQEQAQAQVQPAQEQAQAQAQPAQEQAQAQVQPAQEQEQAQVQQEQAQEQAQVHVHVQVQAQVQPEQVQQALPQSLLQVRYDDVRVGGDGLYAFLNDLNNQMKDIVERLSVLEKLRSS